MECLVSLVDYNDTQSLDVLSGRGSSKSIDSGDVHRI